MAGRLRPMRALSVCSSLLASLLAGCAFHPQGLIDWSKPVVSYERNSPLGYTHQLMRSMRDELLLMYYEGWEAWDPETECPEGWACVRDRKITHASIGRQNASVQRQNAWRAWRDRCEYATRDDAYCQRGFSGRYDALQHPHRWKESNQRGDLHRGLPPPPRSD